MENFDNDPEVDKFGKDEVGRQWAKMSIKDKVDVISGIVNDEEEFEERLSGTKFNHFLAALEFFIGGSNVQDTLLSNQVEVALKLLPQTVKSKGNITECIHDIYNKCTTIGRSTEDLGTHFWMLFSQLKNDNDTAEVDPSGYSMCFAELESYYKLAESLGWESEKEKARDEMKNFLSDMLEAVSYQEKHWSLEKFLDIVRKTKTKSKSGKAKAMKTEDEFVWKAPKKLKWDSLSPLDWESILSSILLPMGEIELYQDYGIEKTVLEKSLLYFRMKFDPRLTNSEVLTKEEETYMNAVRKMNKGEREAIIKVKTPSKLSDPTHWGHIGYRYVMFIRNHSN